MFLQTGSRNKNHAKNAASFTRQQFRILRSQAADFIVPEQISIGTASAAEAELPQPLRLIGTASAAEAELPQPLRLAGGTLKELFIKAHLMYLMFIIFH